MPLEGWKTITIPEEIWVVLKDLSQRSGKSIGEIVSEAVRAWLLKNEAKMGVDRLVVDAESSM